MRLLGGARAQSRSLRLRLTVALGLIAAMVFAVAGGCLYYALAYDLEDVDRNELLGKQSLISHYIGEASAETDLAVLKHHVDDAVAAHGQLRVWLLSERSEVVLGAGDVPREVARSGDLMTLLTADGLRLEGIQSPVVNGDSLHVASMLVAIDTRPRLRLLEKYRWMLWLVCGLGVLTISTLAAWTTGRAVMPVRRLSAEAARISPTSLSTRLETAGVDLELKDLVQGFNAALDRVEGAYRQMESFTADVAHELRTPLATLINAVEVTLREERSPQVLRETLAEQLEELEQLKGLVVDMLFLSRADQGDQPQDAIRVLLSNEVRKTVEYYEALLSEAEVGVIVDGEATVLGNAGLIRRALANLLSNAIKNTKPGASIHFRLRMEQGLSIAEVRNPGSPIADEVRTRMFDRFFRADQARSQRGTSHGLGLAIVKAIAEMHGGEVFATSDAGGNTIGFRMPIMGATESHDLAVSSSVSSSASQEPTTATPIAVP